MTLEQRMLVCSVFLGLVQIVLSSHAASRQYGYRWAASARDQPMPPLAGVAGGLDHALRDFLETFPLFAAAGLFARLCGPHQHPHGGGVNVLLSRRSPVISARR